MGKLARAFQEAFQKGQKHASAPTCDQAMQQQLAGLENVLAAINAQDGFSAVLDPRLEGVAKLIIRIAHHDSGILKNFRVVFGRKVLSGKTCVQVFTDASDQTPASLGERQRFDVSGASGQHKLVTVMAGAMAEAIAADARLRAACAYALKNKHRTSPQRKV